MSNESKSTPEYGRLRNFWQSMEFIEEPGAVSLIPSNWILSSGKECYWPPGNYDATPLIKKGQIPKPNWRVLKIQILRSGIDSYEKARKVEQKASKDLSLDTTDYETPRSTKPAQKVVRNIFPTQSRSSNAISTKKPDSQPGPSSRKSVVQQKSFSLGLASLSPDEADASSSDSDILNNYVPLCSEDELRAAEKAVSSANRTLVENKSPVFNDDHLALVPESRRWDTLSIEDKLNEMKSSQEAFQKTVIEILAEVKIDVKDLLARSAGSSLRQRHEHLSGIPFDMPLKSREELHKLEQWVADSDSRIKLTAYCATFGGNGTGKVVRTILSRLFTAKLAQGINFIGGGAQNKIGFKDLKGLRRVVIDATRQNKDQANTSEQDIESIVKVYFRNARDLDGGAAERKKSNLAAVENGILQHQTSENNSGN